ncbi:hypothetical protein [Nocardia bovistercoris]|uniref:Uncharacterized protein n=1 Tax=Nocardia bovistercoris TaxID=2785916 RepID=A0A931IHX5_9NOCA|nr:hypothetical protein [Nocardia bovistercoris]MBH0780025.1 hypothetical protein [Nocardia bovistercoris]
MTDAAVELEERIAGLRAEVRRAAAGGDRAGARRLRAELRRVENQWETAVLGEASAAEPESGDRESTPVVAVRDHVHRALTLLSAPASPKVVMAVHEGFFSGQLVAARLTSLRRDEERSFRAAPYGRPFYICAALTTDLIAPARGLLAVSTWSLARRMIGPLSPRVDLLTAVIRLAEHMVDQNATGPAAQRVLWRLAVSVPGVAGSADALDPAAVAAAARRELAVHAEDDTGHREQAARRVARQLDDAAGQLFGVRLRAAERRGNEW